jgi:hypothetical protein
VFQAEIAARELGWLNLRYALDLVLLYAETDSTKFEPAAVRWLSRYALEGRDVRLVDVQLAAVALASLRGLRRDRAEKTLLGLL